MSVSLYVLLSKTRRPVKMLSRQLKTRQLFASRPIKSFHDVTALPTILSIKIHSMVMPIAISIGPMCTCSTWALHVRLPRIVGTHNSVWPWQTATWNYQQSTSIVPISSRCQDIGIMGEQIVMMSLAWFRDNNRDSSFSNNNNTFDLSPYGYPSCAALVGWPRCDLLQWWCDEAQSREEDAVNWGCAANRVA